MKDILFMISQNSSRLEVTYANNNNLIKKFENMPNIERPTSATSPSDTNINNSSEEKSSSTTTAATTTNNKKKVNGIRKVFSERSKSLISSSNGSGGKQKINTDAYF